MGELRLVAGSCLRTASCLSTNADALFSPVTAVCNNAQYIQSIIMLGTTSPLSAGDGRIELMSRDLVRMRLLSTFSLKKHAQITC